jgi:hypothetical protein
LRNAEGDEVVVCEVRYPIAAGCTAADIRAILETRVEFRPADTASWSWIDPKRPLAQSTDDNGLSQESLTFETWLDDGALVLGSLELRDGALVLAVNSRNRSDLGSALLSGVLGTLVGPPSIKVETIEQIMATGKGAAPQGLDIPEEESQAIVHEHLERHYRSALDQPISMLGGESPRAAVRSDDGRIKVADWLKMMENRTARSARPGSALASYNFGWLWAELGINELRR